MAAFEYRQAERGAEIERGKDFVQLKNGPFDLDPVFAPDGIERFGAPPLIHGPGRT